MTKKSKKLIKNPIFFGGLCLLIIWLVVAFIFKDSIGMTGNPTFLQVQTQMLPASIGIFLMLFAAIKNITLLYKILLIIAIVMVAAYILYFGLGLLLIMIYGLNIDWSNYSF